MRTAVGFEQAREVAAKSKPAKIDTRALRIREDSACAGLGTCVKTALSGEALAVDPLPAKALV